MTCIEFLEHKILEAVKSSGGALYQVGGAVRDKFLNLENKDVELVPAGSAELEIFNYL